MGADRDPSAGQSGSGGFAAAVADAMSATGPVTKYHFGPTEAVPGGVCVTGTETCTWPSDTTFTVAMHADGQTVMLGVNSASFGLTREAARILGAELSRFGQGTDGAADARTDDRVSVATAWDAEANEKAARDRAFTEAFERIAAQGIRDAAEVNRSALSGQRFPLDAEQIVRLTGAVLTRVLNASRPADSRAVEEEDLTVALGEAAGVPLPIARNEWGILRLQPYGTVTEPTKDEPASQQPGGSREG